MSLLVIGLNHTTASVEVRERVAFTPDQVPEALSRGCDKAKLNELMILSTCNRTELFAAFEGDSAAAEDRVIDWLASTHRIERTRMESALYRMRDADAMRHLIRVACGLDSMVMGEPQILGQLKDAYATARNAGTMGSELSKAVSHGFSIAKRVRTDTAIGENPVSVAYAAVKLAGHIFSDLSRTTALLLGAGETIELVARHLHEAGIARIIVANRTLERAEGIADRVSGEAIMLGDMPEHLHRADIVISSTASQLPVLGKGAVERAVKQRRHKPMFMVDIAVPRDIEAEVGEMSDVYLYTVDDLEEIVAENRKAREHAAEKALQMVDEGVQEYLRGLRGLDAVGALRDVRGHAEALRDQELEKAVRQLRNGADSEQVLWHLARNLTNKLMHGPSVQMRKAGEQGREDLLEWSRLLFGVEDADNNDNIDPKR